MYWTDTELRLYSKIRCLQVNKLAFVVACTFFIAQIWRSKGAWMTVVHRCIASLHTK